MRIIDHSPFVDEKGEVPLVERIRGTLKFGSSWYADIQAQETVISHLSSALDDGFTLLRNLTLPGLEIPIPLILIGPPGIHVLYASAMKGIYQANAEQWRVMNTNSRRFRPSRPNLIQRTLLYNQAVERHLARHEISLPTPVEPVAVFTDPGIHVDTKRPAVRIVMIDALDRYAASVAQSTNLLNSDLVARIVKALTSPPPAAEVDEALRTPEGQLLASDLADRAGSSSLSEAPEINVPFLGPIRFSLRQWIVLGVLVLINMIVLAIFIILVLTLPLS